MLKKDLLNQYKNEVEAVNSGMLAAESRGNKLIAQFAHDLEVYSVQFAVQMAYVELDKLAQTLDHQYHANGHYNSTCKHCQDYAFSDHNFR